MLGGADPGHAIAPHGLVLGTVRAELAHLSSRCEVEVLTSDIQG